MIDVIILAIGKVKEVYFAEAINEYLKRLKPYARVKLIELSHESFSPGEEQKAKNREGEKILKYLETCENSKIVVLDERGKEFSSEEFSQFLSSPETFVFVIGGTVGLADEVLKKANYRLSLSAMTFPHEMARLFLCEQLYRAVTIQKGKSYHY